MKYKICSSLLCLPLVAAGFAMPSIALAQDSCDGSRSNVEYKDCLHQRFEEADGNLNRVYRKVKAGLGAEQKEILTDAQLAWITYRDKGCEFETFGSRRGTGYRGFLSQCKERVTMVRLAELEGILRDR
jgi:uncharacterized protein YecT (DUF1311 family)